MPCSYVNSYQTRICYPPEDVEEQCPITRIFFVTLPVAENKARDGQPLEIYPDSKSYEFSPVSETHSIYLSYTKKVSNTLPLTNFAIDSDFPCMLPQEKFTRLSDVLYPLELDRNFPRNCSANEVSKLKRDNGYVNLAIETTQLQIQN